MSECLLACARALSGYVEQVEIKRIRLSNHPLRGELTSVEDLMASIMETGLLEPIVVRPVKAGFEVVAGNRRLEACRRLKFNKIQCHIVELEDKEAYEVSLTENLQRRTLNPIEEGTALKKYVDDYGYGGVSELARKIGKSHSYVSRRISMLSLPDSLKEDIVRRRTTPSVASELLSLDEEDQAEFAKFFTEVKSKNRNEVRSIVRHLRRRGEAQALDTEPQSPSYYELIEIKAHVIDRALARCIASLKHNMNNFDEAMDSLNEEDEESWLVREALTWHRRSMNEQVDSLLRLRKKFRSVFR